MEIDKQNFTQWLQLKELSQRSIENYLYYFDLLQLPIEDISQKNINDFITNHHNCVCRGFLTNLLEYLVSNAFDSEILKQIALIRLPRVKGRKKKTIPDILSEAEVHKLANAMNDKNKLMLFIQFYGALRVSELLNIKPDSFNWSVWIREQQTIGKMKVSILGKTGQRIVFIPAWLMKNLYDWIKKEISQKQEKNEVLFSMRIQSWNRILDNTSRKVLGKRLHSHLLRHAFATLLNEKGLGIEEVKEYLGHESIQSTQVYTHISRKRLYENYKKALQ